MAKRKKQIDLPAQQQPRQAVDMNKPRRVTEDLPDGSRSVGCEEEVGIVAMWGFLGFVFYFAFKNRF